MAAIENATGAAGGCHRCRRRSHRIQPALLGASSSPLGDRGVPGRQNQETGSGITTSGLPLAAPLCQQFLPLAWQVAPPLEDLQVHRSPPWSVALLRTLLAREGRGPIVAFDQLVDTTARLVLAFDHAVD